jgi:serine/threonine-protein kinase
MAPVLGVTDSPQEPPESADRLDSWKEIAVYLGRSVRTVRRWEESEGLPVHRHLHEKAGSVYAFRPELDAWRLRRRIEPASTARTEDAAAPRGSVPLRSVIVTGLLAIGAVVSQASPVRRAPPVSPAADDLYRRGQFEMGRTRIEGFRAAISYFEQAIAKQPDFAKAYAALAEAQTEFLYNGPWSPDEVLPKAEAAARKALSLDDTLRDARDALITVLRTYGDHAGADAELARLNAQRRADQMSGTTPVGSNGPPSKVAAAERAREHPFSVQAALKAAYAYRAVGDHTRAIAEFKRAHEMQPTRANIVFQLGVTFVFQQNLKEAIPALERAVDLSTQRNPRYLAYLGKLHAMDGRKDETRRILRELLARQAQQYVSSFGLALLYDALGEKADAMSALERAAREHAIEFTQLSLYPPFETLASEPRYRELMRTLR